MKIKIVIALLLIPCLKSYASKDLKSVSGQFGFIENKGQIMDQNNNPNPSVLYLYNGNGLQVQLKQTGFSYEVWKVAVSLKLPEAYNQELIADTVFTHRIDISFVNANTNAKIISSDVAPDYINYYTTGTSEQGVTNAHHYKKVLYQNIYKNIDVEFVLNENKFKYNFIIHPEGNPNDIQLKFDGANATSLTKDGHITIETAYGNIDESIPLSYQLEANNTQRKVDAYFTSNLQYPNSSIYGIAVGQYDATKTLIIDPFPSTYLGGSLNDVLNTIATDNIHNIIAYGATNSSSSIATSGAFQTSFIGISNAFIAKFNSASAIKWCTYFGGTLQTGPRAGNSVAIDSLNNIFITGTTSSNTNISTTGVYQSSLGGGIDAFIEKFDSSGTRQWGTYFGGTAIDQSYGIAIDRIGNLLIAGFTASSSSIATSGANKTSYSGGGYDAFVSKFNSSGTNCIWATYYGGSGGDFGQGISIDQNNNVYMAGYTSSTTGIASSGSWQSTYGGGVDDAFIVKFDSSGNRLWGTYYGLDQTDVALAIGLDVSGNVLVTGNTNSGSGFATIGPTYHGGSSYGDAFILKFSSSGSRIWSTYFGGSNDDLGQCLAFDYIGNVFVTGMTNSTDSISTPGSYQTTYGGGLYDAFIVKLNSTGIRQWATYFGYDMADIGYGIVIEWNGEILITGQTSSSSGIVSSGSYQNIYGGGPGDGFIASFNISGSLPVQLTSFDAKRVNDKDVLCTWQTASELNNDYFEIQRSVDGSQFTAIGKVKGNVTSEIVHGYQFTDNSLSSVNNEPLTIYYRLKQLDLDGKSSFSDIRVVSFNQVNTNWNIYPNPTTNELHIETTGTEKLTAQVFDITSKQVISTILFTSSTIINTSSLYEGMYFVRITDANGAIVTVQKVAVAK